MSGHESWAMLSLHHLLLHCPTPSFQARAVDSIPELLLAPAFSPQLSGIPSCPPCLCPGLQPKGLSEDRVTQKVGWQDRSPAEVQGQT